MAPENAAWLEDPAAAAAAPPRAYLPDPSGGDGDDAMEGAEVEGTGEGFATEAAAALQGRQLVRERGPRA